MASAAPQMKAGALDEFLSGADPWLIAEAMTMSATVVTHKQLNLAARRKYQNLHCHTKSAASLCLICASSYLFNSNQPTQTAGLPGCVSATVCILAKVRITSRMSLRWGTGSLRNASKMSRSS